MSGVTLATTIRSISDAGTFLAGEELARGSRGQVRRADALVGDVAFADAGALPNPGIVGFHQLFQIGIGHHPGRHVPAHTGNLCCNASGHSVSVRLVDPRLEESRFYAIEGGETSLVWPCCSAVVTRIAIRDADRLSACAAFDRVRR